MIKIIPKQALNKIDNYSELCRKGYSCLPLGYGSTEVAGCIQHRLPILYRHRCSGSKLHLGWGISLGLATVPAAIMILGASLISDTPSNLVERGEMERAQKSLERVRGSELESNVTIENELAELVKSSEIAKAINQEPFVIIFERQIGLIL